MKNNIKLRRLILVLLPGILFFLAWPPRPLFFLGFIGFVPLFILENEVEGKKFGWLTYLSLVFFNTIITWWVGWASFGGSIAMILANSGLMLIPFSLYRQAKKVFSPGKALMGFVFFWMSFEFLHFNWEITWPWLTLGYLFAKAHHLVQWYEFTGTLGGSLWVLVLNVLCFQWFQNKDKKSLRNALLALVVPMVISFIVLGWYQLNPLQPTQTKTALIIQPNINPYQKFDKKNEDNTNAIFSRLIRENIQPNTPIIIFPETAIAQGMNEDYFDDYISIDSMKFWAKEFNTSIITGASTYKFHPRSKTKPTPTARLYQEGLYYDSYNTALLIENEGVEDVYHKSKLVPGVERMPYPQIFSFLEYFSIDMGGTTGSLGVEHEAKDFTTKNNIIYAPLICYESIFHDYVSDFVRKGADALLVITNDGWWKETDGHRQHLYYAKLRAIENRREILRSANTGISAHIDAFGNITKSTGWWVEDAIHTEFNLYDTKTIFTRTGDFVGRICAFIGVALILGIFVKKRTRKNSSIF